MVQEHKTPLVPELCTSSPKDEDRMAVLENIKAMVPDHNARVSSAQVRYQVSIGHGHTRS